jgi:[ribosomal protein S18]-alanine N-acetyltransferase
LKIRRIESRDIDAVVALQSSCPEIAQWTGGDYERVARGEMMSWVAEDETGLAGFLVARELVQETEILNLAVRASERRGGTGSVLLKEALDWSRSRAEKVVLEVRASNDVALRFYERHGFRAVGRRPNYYTAPVEDALVLCLLLSTEANRD